MITWLQTSFGKHHKLVLGLLLGITIISFVFFGAWSGAQSGMRSSTYLGVNLGSPRDLERHEDAIRMRGYEASQIPMELWQQQIFQTHLADALQIPNPTPSQLRTLLEASFGGPAEVGAKLAQEIQRASAMLGVNEQRAKERLERFFNDAWRSQRAQEILRGPGFARPRQAAMQWKQENTDWSIGTATLRGNTFNPVITPDETQLQTYFDNQKEKYRLPPRQTIAYAIFPAATDATAPVPTPTDAELRKYALDHPATLPGFDTAKFEESLSANRAEITRLWQAEQLGMRTASEASAILANDLPFEDAPPPFSQIEEALAARNIKPRQIPDFDKDTIPTDQPVPQEILRRGLDLSTAQWRSDAYTLGTDAVVLFHLKTAPSRLPELAEVRDKVALDFAAQEKVRLFNERIVALGQQLRAAVTGGKDFASAAAELGFEVKSYPTFKLAGMPAEFYSIAGTLLRGMLETPVGGISPVLRLGGDAFYVQVVQKTEPAVDINAPELRTIQGAIAQESAVTNFYGVQQLGLEGVLLEIFNKTRHP